MSYRTRVFHAWRAAAAAWVLATATVAAAGDFPEVRDTEPDKTPVDARRPRRPRRSGCRRGSGSRSSPPSPTSGTRSRWPGTPGGGSGSPRTTPTPSGPPRFDLRLRDRVLIFEDADGDGRFDRRTVFTDDVQMLTSVEVGLGGRLAALPAAAPLRPRPRRRRRPDGRGRGRARRLHRPARELPQLRQRPALGARRLALRPLRRLGPRPDRRPRARPRPTASRSRRPLAVPPRTQDGSRPSPTARPTPGATTGTRSARRSSSTPSTATSGTPSPGCTSSGPTRSTPTRGPTQPIDQHADHWHWDTAKDWTDSRNATGEHDRRGGGHAHSGLMIYLGDQWPAADRGKLFTLNFHGRRVNVERLERVGQRLRRPARARPLLRRRPLVPRHRPRLRPRRRRLRARLERHGECHESTGVHRTSGRIFKFTYGEPEARRRSATWPSSTSAALVDLHRHPNEWYARMARRQLADRAGPGRPARRARPTACGRSWPATPTRPASSAPSGRSTPSARPTRRLLRPLLRHDHEAVRAWAIRLLTDAHAARHRDEPPARPRRRACRPTCSTSSPGWPARTARAWSAWCWPRPSSGSRSADAPELAAPLLARERGRRRPQPAAPDLVRPDPGRRRRPLGPGPARRRLRPADDPPADRPPAGRGPRAEPRPARRPAGRAAARATIRRVPGRHPRRARRGPPRLAEGPEARRLGRARPRGSASSADAAIRDRVRDLDVLFGDGRALDEVRRLALDDKADLESRRPALRTLIEARPPDLRAICERLLRVRFLNATAVARAWPCSTTRRSAGRWRRTTGRSTPRSARRCSTPWSRARRSPGPCSTRWPPARSPAADLTAFHARQIRSLGDPTSTGSSPRSGASSATRPPTSRRRSPGSRPGSRPRSWPRPTGAGAGPCSTRLCASCHTLYGHGGEIGPDLTGSGRDNLDYLLENIVDPSATVNADFRMVVVAMDDGRVLNGLVRSRTDRTLTLQTQTEALVLEPQRDRADRAPRRSR